jgi:integrase
MDFTNEHGIRVRKSTETSNKKLAENILAKNMTEVAEGRWFENAVAKTKTFDEMMAKYFQSIRNKRSTLERKEDALPHLRAFFSGFKLIAINPGKVDAYKKWRLDAGAADSTVRNEVNLLSNAFNVVRWRKDNPVREAKTVKLDPQPVHRYLHREEEELLVQETIGRLNGDLTDIVFLDLHTGLSQEEILSLKWDQIDFMCRSLNTIRKKTLNARTVPLNDVAYEIVVRRSKAKADSGYVFVNSAGNQHDAGKLKRVFKNALDEAGIKGFSFHCLRKTFGTRLAQAGVDIYTISRLMGHKDVSTTAKYYLHHCLESLRRGVQVLNPLNPCENLCHNFVTVTAESPKVEPCASV